MDAFLLRADDVAPDWRDWHREYDDPNSRLSRRLRVVQDLIRDALDRCPPGPIRAISVCAGEARDLLGVLADHPRAGIAYERLGLTEPSHTLEEPLPACGEFRWTVRARFRLDGLSRATEWTGAYNTIGGCADPAWIRGHPGKPALALIPGDETLFYPIIQSPSADGEACECR